MDTKLILTEYFEDSNTLIAECYSDIDIIVFLKSFSSVKLVTSYSDGILVYYIHLDRFTRPSDFIRELAQAMGRNGDTLYMTDSFSMMLVRSGFSPAKPVDF